MHFLFPVVSFSFFSCNHFHADGLHLSHAHPCSSVSSLSNSTFLLDVQSSADKKLATTQERQILQNSDEKQYCHSYIAKQTMLSRCYCTDKSLSNVCIFAGFKVNCKVMPLRSFADFKLIMSRHRKDLRGALGHGLCGLRVNPSLLVGSEIFFEDKGGVWLKKGWDSLVWAMTS